VRRIVYASCTGRDGSPIRLRAGDGYPRSPYAAAKLAGEIYLRAYAAMYDLAPTCLALANVYGPRQRPRGSADLIAILGSAMLTSRPLAVCRNGGAAFDYVYVDDVVEAFMCAGSARTENAGTYTIGTGRRTTVAEVQRLICAVIDAPSAQPAAACDHETHAAAPEVRRAEKELGWKPTISLAEGIERTVRWLSATLAPKTPTHAHAGEFNTLDISPAEAVHRAFGDRILDDDLVVSG
jgi:UDP-glucose 4-epimerase